MSNVIRRAIDGQFQDFEVFLRAVEQAHNEWERSEIDVPIHEFLGMSEIEYSIYLTHPYRLKYIVNECYPCARINGSQVYVSRYRADRCFYGLKGKINRKCRKIAKRIYKTVMHNGNDPFNWGGRLKKNTFYVKGFSVRKIMTAMNLIAPKKPA